jgi:hypothetical protein
MKEIKIKINNTFFIELTDDLFINISYDLIIICKKLIINIFIPTIEL